MSVGQEVAFVEGLAARSHDIIFGIVLGILRSEWQPLTGTPPPGVPA